MGYWIQEREHTKVLLENILGPLSDLFDNKPEDPTITNLQAYTLQYLQRIADLSNSIGVAYFAFDTQQP